jgi:hypothetical protein
MWRRVVSFKARLLYLKGMNPQYSLSRRVSGPLSRCGRGGEVKNPCPSRESNPGRSARSLVTVLTSLFRLLNCRFVTLNIVIKAVLSAV